MTKTIARCSIIVAINIISSYIFKFLPNVKPDTTFVILLAVYYSFQECLFVFTATVLLRGFLYGIGTFLPFQWLAWFLIAIIARVFKNLLSNNKIFFVIYSAISGLIFGFIVSLDTLLLFGSKFFITYWLNGLMFDLFHLSGNIVFSVILLNIIIRVKKITDYF